MLKRLGRKTTNGAADNNDAQNNRTSIKKSKNEPVEKLPVDPKGGANGVAKPHVISPTTESVEDKLRESMKKNQEMESRVKKMEDAMRQIAQKAKISEKDIENMDIMDISAKLIEFVTAATIPSPQSFSPKVSNSALIDEVFDELDEHERKYQEELQDIEDAIIGDPTQEDDDEFEDDVPPKKVH